MTFEFLLSYCQTSRLDIRATIQEILTRSLENNFNEFDPDEIAEMISFEHRRLGAIETDDDGNSRQKMILGFTLELPEEINEA